MITWQDPVALALAVICISLALWWRRSLIKRGEGTHCQQCTVGDDAPLPRTQKPTVVDVANLRLGKRRS